VHLDTPPPATPQRALLEPPPEPPPPSRPRPPRRLCSFSHPGYSMFRPSRRPCDQSNPNVPQCSHRQRADAVSSADAMRAVSPRADSGPKPLGPFQTRALDSGPGPLWRHDGLLARRAPLKTTSGGPLQVSHSASVGRLCAGQLALHMAPTVRGCGASAALNSRPRPSWQCDGLLPRRLPHQDYGWRLSPGGSLRLGWSLFVHASWPCTWPRP
jgi:hypothetical protein